MKTCWKSWKRKQALIKGTKLACDLKWLSVIKSFQGEKVVSSSLIKRKTRRVHLCSCFKGASKKYVVEEEREKKMQVEGRKKCMKECNFTFYASELKERKERIKMRIVMFRWTGFESFFYIHECCFCCCCSTKRETWNSLLKRKAQKKKQRNENCCWCKFLYTYCSIASS